MTREQERQPTLPERPKADCCCKFAPAIVIKKDQPEQKLFTNLPLKDELGTVRLAAHGPVELISQFGGRSHQVLHCVWRL
jgi:hypothetical protein